MEDVFILDPRIEQVDKIVKALTSSTMYPDTDIMIDQFNNVIIVIDNTIMYTTTLKNIVEQYPPIAFNYAIYLEYVETKGSVWLPVDYRIDSISHMISNNRLLMKLNATTSSYLNIKSYHNPVAHDDDLRANEEFEKLLSLRADDGLKFFVMNGLDLNTYKVPMFSGFPSVSKQDKVGISIYDIKDGHLLIDLCIYKKKISRDIHMMYRTLKLY